MPVKSRGRKLVEVKTGHIVGRCKSKKSCKSAARARNAALHGWKPKKRGK